jgi:hypothetical protein
MIKIVWNKLLNVITCSLQVYDVDFFLSRRKFMSFEMLRFKIWISISWELGNSLNFHFINSMFVGYVSIMDIKLRDMNDFLYQSLE